MMNMVQWWHKSAFVSPPSRDHSRPATASQSGSKWPKGSRPKKKSTQTCAAQWSMQITAPTAPTPEHIPTSSIPPGLGSSSFGPSEVYSQRCRLEVLSCTHVRRQREKFDFFFFVSQTETDLTGTVKTLGWGGGLIIEKKNDIPQYSGNYPSRSPQADRRAPSCIQLGWLFDNLGIKSGFSTHTKKRYFCVNMLNGKTLLLKSEDGNMIEKVYDKPRERWAVTVVPPLDCQNAHSDS